MPWSRFPCKARSDTVAGMKNTAAAFLALLLVSCPLYAQLEGSALFSLLMDSAPRVIAESSAPLGASAPFAGPTVDASTYRWITATVSATAAGPGAGPPGVIYLEWSPNGNTWYSQPYPFNGGIIRSIFSMQFQGLYARARLENWEIAQGTLAFQAFLHNETPAAQMAELDHPLFGPFITAGLITGEVLLAAGVESEIWPFPSSSADFTATGVVTVSSTNGGDNPAGAGAGTIVIQGTRDPDGIAVTEILALDGTNDVSGTVVLQNPLIRLIALPGALADPTSKQIPLGDIIATIGGANAGRIPLNSGNQSSGASRRIASIPGAMAGTQSGIFDQVVVAAEPSGAAGVGTVEFQLFTKSPGSIWRSATEKIILPTNAPSTEVRPLNVAIVDGSLISMVGFSTRNLQVEVSIQGKIYGPRLTVYVDP